MPNAVKYREADGATVIVGSTIDDGQIVSSPSVVVFTTPKKVTLENVDTRTLGVSPFSGISLVRTQVGSSDGLSFVRTAADPNGTISKPWGVDVDASNLKTGAPTAENVGGPYGVWASAGNKGVVVTATNALGETIASVEKVFEVTDLTDEWSYAWVQVPGATGYKVYRTDSPGTYDAYSLIATIGSGAVLTYDDDGSPATVGDPPADNTTGGAGPTYGTAPINSAFGTADLTIATDPAGLQVGQQWFFWMIERLPAATTSTGNKRAMQLFPTEA